MLVVYHLNRTGSRKFQTIKNPLPDLRQQKNGKPFQMITGPYKALK